MKQILNFAIVGTVGFIVDASILILLVEYFFYDVSISRFFSFLIAVFVTWVLNRFFTFNKKNKYSKKKEYIYYFIIQTLGATLNYIIFIALIKNSVFFENYLVISLAVASIIAMFFNFFMLKRKIYN